VNTITQVASTDAAKQPNRQGMIRPVEGAAAPISPRNGIVVMSGRPQFAWYSVPGASSYTVQIRRTDEAGAKPLRFTGSKDTVWSYPVSSPALVPGAKYQWTVGAEGGRVAGLQTFRVATEDEAERITSTIKQLKDANIDPATDGLFILALAYRDAGMMYEARNALKRLEAMGDGKGRVYHLLRGDILNAIGDIDGASNEFKAADAESGA
jgi:hypothetical protein